MRTTLAVLTAIVARAVLPGRPRDPLVQGVEQDWTGTCFDEYLNGPFDDVLGRLGGKDCARTWNTAIGQLDLDSSYAKETTLPPGFGGAGAFNMRIDAIRGGVRFEVDVRIDVWTG